MERSKEEQMFVDKKLGLDSSAEELKDIYVEYSKLSAENITHWMALPNFSVFIASYAFRLVSNYVKQSHSSILDVGCGTGVQASYWKTKGFDRVEGCDIGIHFASEYMSRGIPFKTVDLNSEDLVLPYSDNEFDIVTCSHVLEHIKYPKIVVEELVRVSKDLVILTSPMGRSHFSESHIHFWNDPGEVARNIMPRDWAFSIELVISSLLKDIGAGVDEDGIPFPIVRQMSFIAAIYKQFNADNEWMWNHPEITDTLKKSRKTNFLFLYPEDDLFGEKDYELAKYSV
jgi:SAM-dependent methyltransferase